MRVSLTETAPDSGSAKLHILESRSVLDATYTISEGEPRPES